MGVAASRRRVLWLIKGLGAGGAERLLVSMATVRDRAAFDYRLAYLLPWKDALVAEVEALDVPVRCLGVRDERDLRWANTLRRLLLDDPVDIVHTHSPYVAGIARLVRATLPRRCRPAIVSTEHNGWPTFAMPTRLLNALTYPLAQAGIAVSDEVRNSVWPPFRGRVRTVVHGVPLDTVREHRRARDTARAELGVAPGEIMAGTIANYNDKKDYASLLRAMQILDQRDAPVRLCAVGQGPLESEIRAERDRLRLGHRVVLTGYRADALDLMAACDLFVLSSHHEGLPVALMEALALGLPVVATSVGGVPEAVRDGVEGVLVPPRRPVELADAIEVLVRDSHRRTRLAMAADERAAAFDVADAMRRVEAMYREVAPR